MPYADNSIHMSVSNYKKHIFDQEILKFCLQIFDAVEFQGDLKAFFKQATLDALSYCSDLKEVNSMLESFLCVPRQVILDNHKAILDANMLWGARREREEYFMTIRHLSGSSTFQSWPDFFAAIKSLASDDLEIQDVLVTIRHLVLQKEFQNWSDFFTAIKLVGNKQPLYLSPISTATRHCLPYFQSPASFHGIFRALAEAPQYSEAFAYGQLDSKKWLIDEATTCWGKDWGTVFVLAGWIGVLPRMIYDHGILTTKIRSFDIDEGACKISEVLNQQEVQKDWQYKSSAQDITRMSYPTIYKVQRKDGSLCELADAPDVVINTSCEHIADISSWWSLIPKGTKVILQTNDGFHIPEHVACFKSLNEFEKEMNLSHVDYLGGKALPEFNRYMLIGIK